MCAAAEAATEPGKVTARYDSQMTAHYVGPDILRAFADDDITEIYLNPADDYVRLDTRAR